MSDDLSGFQEIGTEEETYKGITLTQTLELPEGVSMPPKQEPTADESGFISLEYLKPEEADMEMPDPSMAPDIMATKQAFPDEDMQAEIDTTAILSPSRIIEVRETNNLCSLNL